MVVVGNEYITAISDKQTFFVEKSQRPHRARHFPVEPCVKLVGFGVASELAHEVLIARRLSAVGVLLVEAFAGERDILGAGVNRFAPDLWAQLAQELKAHSRRSGHRSGVRKRRRDSWHRGA